MARDRLHKSIAFRYSDPRENRAAELIAIAESNGIDFKDLVTTLILENEDIIKQSPLEVALELKDTLSEAKQLIASLHNLGHASIHSEPVKRAETNTEIDMSDPMIQAISKNANKGRQRRKREQ